MTKADKALFQGMLDEWGNDKDAFHYFTREKIKTDLYYFASEIMGWDKSKKDHKKILDPKLHKWMCKIIELEGDKAVFVARWHLKTTLVKLRIAQRILQNPLNRILYISVAGRLVESGLKGIKRILADPLVREYFPEIPKPGKDFKHWKKNTSQELTIWRDPASMFIPDEPQVMALGLGSDFTGMHFDECFCDDIIDKDTVRTASQMEKSEEDWGFLQYNLMGTPITMTGTFYHHSDLYNRIITDKHFPSNRIFIRSGIIGGKSDYSFFTLKDYEKLKKRMPSDYLFNCQILLDPAPISERILPPPQPTYKPPIPEGENLKYYIAVDPAATTEDYSDATGIVIGAINKINQLYIVDAIKVKIPGNELADLIIQLCIRFSPRRVGIELGLQAHLQHIIELRVADWKRQHKAPINVPLYPLKVSKLTKAQRIANTLGSFVRGARCRINENCTDLIREMDMFTGKGKEQDNLVDAASLLFPTIDSFGANTLAQSAAEYVGMTIKDIFKKSHSRGYRARYAS
jgi:hypothetical protein